MQSFTYCQQNKSFAGNVPETEYCLLKMYKRLKMIRNRFPGVFAWYEQAPLGTGHVTRQFS